MQLYETFQLWKLAMGNWEYSEVKCSKSWEKHNKYSCAIHVSFLMIKAIFTIMICFDNLLWRKKRIHPLEPQSFCSVRHSASAHSRRVLTMTSSPNERKPRERAAEMPLTTLSMTQHCERANELCSGIRESSETKCMINAPQPSCLTDLLLWSPPSASWTVQLVDTVHPSAKFKDIV